MAEEKKKKTTVCPFNKTLECEDCRFYKMRATGHMKCHLEEIADCLGYISMFTGTEK